jgi:predicted metal-dependent hydrolase
VVRLHGSGYAGHAVHPGDISQEETEGLRNREILKPGERETADDDPTFQRFPDFPVFRSSIRYAGAVDSGRLRDALTRRIGRSTLPATPSPPMAVKKSELYSSLWQSCDELRGGMDASQYKDYILVLLFVKYVSDKAASQPSYLLDVPAGGSFADLVALKGDPEIGDKINKIIARLAEANELKGVIDVADFNDPDKLGKGQEMVVVLRNRTTMELRVPPNADVRRRDWVLQRWYRRQLKELIPPLLERWQGLLGVQVTYWGIKKMKTRWGTCNTGARRVWLNLELAKKPIQCLEYLIAHELMHLHERRHSNRFVALMDRHLPAWRQHRQILNSEPLAHENWSY